MPALAGEAVGVFSGPVIAREDIGKRMSLRQRRVHCLVTEQGKQRPPGRQPPVSVTVSLAGGHVERESIGFVIGQRKFGRIGVPAPDRICERVQHDGSPDLEAGRRKDEPLGPRGVLPGTGAGDGDSGGVITVDLIGFQQQEGHNCS